jgi:hypothetical protein
MKITGKVLLFLVISLTRTSYADTSKDQWVKSFININIQNSSNIFKSRLWVRNNVAGRPYLLQIRMILVDKNWTNPKLVTPEVQINSLRTL